MLPFFSLGQENYNNCNEAFSLCPNKINSVNNIGANVTFCPDCEDDLSFCFTPANSIWLTFETNTLGGDVQIDFTNLVFETNPGQDIEMNAIVLEALIPCDAASFSPVSNCATNQGGNFSLLAPALTANTVYYVIVSGDNAGAGISSPAESTFDVSLSGPGIDRPAPTFDIGGNTSVCQGEVITFFAGLSNCTDTSSFNWYVNDTLRAITEESYWSTSEIEDGDIISAQVSCFSDCPDTLNSSFGPITVISFPIDAGEDQIISLGESTVLNGSTNGTDISWSPNIALTDPNVLNPIASPLSTTIYTLQATQNGCTLYDQMTVIIDNNLVIPTTFSPNDDGNNDVWEIEGIENFPNNQVKIYDRWGQIVYQNTGYNYLKAWNGRRGNKEMPEGVYFYSINLRDSESENLRGSITLIR